MIVHVPVSTGGPLSTTLTVKLLDVAINTFLDPICTVAELYHGAEEMIVCVGVYVDIVITPTLDDSLHTISYM